MAYFLNVVLLFFLVSQSLATPIDSFSTFADLYFIDGDGKKFRERKNTRPFPAGFELHQNEREVFKGKFLSEWHFKAVPQNNDYDFLFKLTDALGDALHFSIGIQSFNRYDDPTGGYYGSFTTTPYAHLDKNLVLFDGNLFTNVGGRGSFCHWDFHYRWHRKDGKMGKLNWAQVTEGSTTRKIAPTFTDVRENNHDFSLNLKKTVNETEIKWNNDFSYLAQAPVREEKNLDASADLVKQSTHADDFSFASTLMAERSFKEDEIFGEAIYRFELSDVEEKENLETFNPSGARVGGGTRKNFFGSKANLWLMNNIFHTHGFFDLGNDCFLNTTGRVFYRKRDADAEYYRDSTNPPDLVIDETIFIDTKDSGFGLGERLAASYKGFSWVSPYIQADFEQNFIRLKEDQQDSVTAADNFFRTTDQRLFKYIVATGLHAYPLRDVRFSLNYQFQYEPDFYKDREESVAASSSDKSAFVNKLIKTIQGFKTGIGWKPLSWLNFSAKYDFSKTRFELTKESLLGSNSFSQFSKYSLASTFSFQKFLLSESVFFQDLLTKTPARDVAIATVPRHRGDFFALLSSLNYEVSPHMSATASHEFNISDNFEDFSVTGLPLALDQKEHEFLLSLAWNISTSLDISSSYGYSSYKCSSRSHIDDDDADEAFLNLSGSF